MSTLTQAFVTAALTEEVNLNEAFTRQHYEAIAKILRDYGTGDDSLHPEEFVDKIANKLADFFKQDNPRFDKGFFLSKCGL